MLNIGESDDLQIMTRSENQEVEKQMKHPGVDGGSWKMDEHRDADIFILENHLNE